MRQCDGSSRQSAGLTVLDGNGRARWGHDDALRTAVRNGHRWLPGEFGRVRRHHSDYRSLLSSRFINPAPPILADRQRRRGGWLTRNPWLSTSSSQFGEVRWEHDDFVIGSGGEIRPIGPSGARVLADVLAHDGGAEGTL